MTIVDYGLGNIFSVARAFSFIGCEVEVTSEPQKIEEADFLILPGVGSFKKGMQELITRNLIEPIKAHAYSDKPLLGICLGMQLLFESSEENGLTPGLGLLPGKVVRIVKQDSPVKIPHIGWGRLDVVRENSGAKFSLINSIHQKYAYFVHSYHPLPEATHLLATSFYQGQTINSIVMKNNIIGCQFHPEKSGHNLLAFLQEATKAQCEVVL